jgi:hypothetical protein
MSVLRAFDTRTDLEIVGDKVVLDMVEHGVDPGFAMNLVHGSSQTAPRGLLVESTTPIRMRGQIHVDKQRIANAWRMLQVRR